MKDEDYKGIISQLEKELNSNCALTNNYGIILGSNIEEFVANTVLPQNLLEFITNRNNIETEIKNQQIISFILEFQRNHFVFTFRENFILISKVAININLAEFSKKADQSLKIINEKAKEAEMNKFSLFNFSKEISQIESTLKNDAVFNDQKYDIIKELIKFVSK